MRDPALYRDRTSSMFGPDVLVEEIRDRVPGDGWDPNTADGEPEPEVHPLDSEPMLELHRQLLGHYARELDLQAENRKQMAEDEAFYDGDQWTAEEIAILEERGQVPLVYNVTKTAVDWVLGSQRRQPLDYAILPRRKDGSSHAERKTELMKYLSDVNDAPMHVADAFAEQVKAGLSWLECGVRAGAEEPLYERFESWRNILHDSSARDRDLEDGRYIFRTRWIDVDRARAMFPHRVGVLARCAETVIGGAGLTSQGDMAMDQREAVHQWADVLLSSATEWAATRERVRLIEGWYRTPEETETIVGGDFTGEVYDPRSEGHNADLEEGRATLRSKVRERVRVGIFCEGGMLWEGPSPYRHNRLPFTPLWGNRRASNGLPYGLVRGIAPIQRDVNKRGSKMLFHLSAQRVIAEKGSVDSVEALREESQRPDAVILYKRGCAPPSIAADYQIAAAHAEMMSRGIDLIQQTSGVTDENMGRATNATSGRAILARQEQGQLTTSGYYEALAYARKHHGEKILCNIEQFMDEERQFRVTGKTGQAEFVTINDANPDDDNHITRTKANFVVAERDYRSTERQATMQNLMENLTRIAPAAPELIPAILDIVVDVSDIPHREEIVKRIRAVTGQPDPDADPNVPDPQMEARKAAADAQAALEARGAMAQIAGAEARAQETQARAMKALADAGWSASRAAQYQSEAEQREVEKFRASIEAAILLGQNPGIQIGSVADLIMQAADARAIARTPTPSPPGPQDASPLQAQDAALMPMQPATL